MPKPRNSVHHASAARLVALETIRIVRERTAFTHDVLESRFDRYRLAREERAFATVLALGVASTSGVLDEVIDSFVSDPRSLHDTVRDALRLSTYEILYLDKSAHAAVDQGVELVKSVEPRAAGLANAVLRKIASAKPAFPFGDPRTDLSAFARLVGFPLWLAERLAHDLGQKTACELMRVSNEQAPVYIAVNHARSTDDAVRSVFADAGCPLAPVEFSGDAVEGCYRVAQSRLLGDGRIRHLIATGAILVSDASSQAIASLAARTGKPSTMLEVGAGRATKTILLQSNALRDRGCQMELTTIDNVEFKAGIVRSRAKAYGIEVARCLLGDATKLEEHVGDELFDAVFVDAPCTGLGTLRRHPEIRWRLTERDIARLADLELALLRSASKHVRVGGYLTYATCSVTYAENTGVVKRFLEEERAGSFSLEPIGGASCFSVEPVSGGPDMHFAVQFRRTS